MHVNVALKFISFLICSIIVYLRDVRKTTDFSWTDTVDERELEGRREERVSSQLYRNAATLNCLSR